MSRGKRKQDTLALHVGETINMGEKKTGKAYT